MTAAILEARRSRRKRHPPGVPRNLAHHQDLIRIHFEARGVIVKPLRRFEDIVDGGGRGLRQPVFHVRDNEIVLHEWHAESLQHASLSPSIQPPP